MKNLEKESLRLRRAISGLTLDKLILQKAARQPDELCRRKILKLRSTAHHIVIQTLAC